MSESVLIMALVLAHVITGPGHNGSAYANQKELEIQFTEKTLSVHITSMSLKDVCDRIKQKKAIWFSGSEELLKEKVTVQFENLAIDKGLKRILSRMNYTFIYNRHNVLITVIIIGTKDGKSTQTQTIANFKTNNDSLNHASDRYADSESFEIIPNAPPPGGKVVVNSKEKQAMKSHFSAEPPGGIFHVDPKKFDQFKIDKNISMPIN